VASLQQRLADLISAVKGDFGGLEDRIATLEGAAGGGGLAPIFGIWAEENGNLASNAYEWSYGNGAVGNDIGIILPVPCRLFAVGFNADNAGTSLTMRTLKNNVDAYVSTHVGQNSLDTLPTPVDYAAGDLVGFRTGTLVGTWNDARPVAWFERV